METLCVVTLTSPSVPQEIRPHLLPACPRIHHQVNLSHLRISFSRSFFISGTFLTWSLCPCVSAGVDVWWSNGGHPLLQGGTHLQEVRPLQGSWWGQLGQGESQLVR